MALILPRLFRRRPTQSRDAEAVVGPLTERQTKTHPSWRIRCMEQVCVCVTRPRFLCSCKDFWVPCFRRRNCNALQALQKAPKFRRLDSQMHACGCVHYSQAQCNLFFIQGCGYAALSVQRISATDSTPWAFGPMIRCMHTAYQPSDAISPPRPEPRRGSRSWAIWR